MLSLILSVRQPSGLTQRSRFGSRDLGPPANQHCWVLGMPMPNQIWSGDPLNQTSFISKAPRNTGSLLSDCMPFARMCKRFGSFWHILKLKYIVTLTVHLWHNESRERAREKSIICFKSGFNFRLFRCQDCVLDLHTSHSTCRNEAIIWIHFVGEMTLSYDGTKKYDEEALLWPLLGWMWSTVFTYRW